MKSVKKTLIAITVSGVLTGGAMAAFADTTKDKPFEGVVVEEVINIEQIPKVVQSGSIKIKDDSEPAMAAQTKIDIEQASKIARTALPGKVISGKLDDENGYLIWQVAVVSNKGKEMQLMIDAGNGRLLAMEAGKECTDHDAEHGEHKHSSWKFWEDNDEQGGHEDRD